MTIARPSSDVAVSGWLPSTGSLSWETINETALDTGDWTSSLINGAVTLVEGLDTTLAIGTHYSRLHLATTEGTTSARVHLMSGEISKGASTWQTITTTPTTYTFSVATSASTNQAALELASVDALLLEDDEVLLTEDGELLLME